MAKACRILRRLRRFCEQNENERGRRGTGESESYRLVPFIQDSLVVRSMSDHSIQVHQLFSSTRGATRDAPLAVLRRGSTVRAALEQRIRVTVVYRYGACHCR